LCGCAWAGVPDPFVVNTIDPPAVFASSGFRVASRSEIEAAGLTALIQRDFDLQSGLSFVGKNGYQT
jgi:hypothetical protein